MATAEDPIALLVSPIDSTITTERWIASHPTDSLTRTTPPQLGLNGVCAAARRTSSHGALTIVRFAGFNVPSPPPDFSFGDTTRLGERKCVLRWIAIAIVGTDPQGAKHLVDSIRAAANSSVHVTERGDSFIAGGPTPGPDDRFSAQGDGAVDPARITLDSALAWAHVTRPFPDTGRISDTAAFAVVRTMIEGARSASPDDRAAMLLAADLLTSIARGAYPLTDSVGQRARDSLRTAPWIALGAHYSYIEPDAEMVYRQNWRLRAYEASPLSRAGRAAFMLLIRSGWAADSNPAGPDSFERVIQHGEQALRENAADSTTLHVALAQAYQDVVALSHGLGAEFADSTQFKPRAAEARRRAIEHARAALPRLKSKRECAELWTLAFRMMIDAPVTTYFFFVND